MKFIKTIKNWLLGISISKLFEALAISGFCLASLLASINVAIAQSGGPDDSLDVICLEHKRKTIITYYSADDVWCAMDNLTDCSKKRGIATSRACDYSVRKAKPFLEKFALANNTPAVDNQSNAIENAPSTAPEAASVTTPSIAPAEQEKLQDELLALQERLVALRVKQLELRKREMELRKNLADTEGGAAFN